MSVPHPIPYQGSKRMIAHHIINLIPANTIRVIEPFAGSAAVSLAAAFHSKAGSFWINDLNEALMAVWVNILNDPQSLANEYEQHWHQQLGNEKSYYTRIRDHFNQTHQPGDFLYLLARCVKAAVRYNSRGDFNQSPDNRRKGTNPNKMRTNILSASNLLKGRTLVTSLDYKAVVSQALSTDVVYMDPPYQGVSSARDKRYIDGLSFEDFIQSLDDLNQRGISYIVSYDGKTGNKSYGANLSDYVDVYSLEIDAGLSSQATLLGRHERTIESLYVSPSLILRLGRKPQIKNSEQIILQV